MTCCGCRGAESVFSQRYVAKELKRYRRHGPRSTTKMLLSALTAEGVEGATLLDIGGGIGVIQHELLEAGASRAVGAEAVDGYLEVARREAARRGLADRLEQRYGDFVQLAPQLQEADVVTLDRVICCYPDMNALVGLSVDKARRLYGVVYPRHVWWTRLGLRFLNVFLWIARNPFRVFTHHTDDVDRLIRRAGFQQRYYRETLLWQVVLYRRNGSGR